MVSLFVDLVDLPDSGPTNINAWGTPCMAGLHEGNEPWLKYFYVGSLVQAAAPSSHIGDSTV